METKANYVLIGAATIVGALLIMLSHGGVAPVEEAIRLAEEAQADAQLSRAVAASERSRRALSEVEASLATLRDEMSRGASVA